MKLRGSTTLPLSLLLLLAGCVSAPPAAPRQGGIDIDHMLIPAADQAGTAVAAYAGFDNHGAADRLLGIDCDCAASVELHTVVRDGDEVRMTNTFPLALPPGRTEVRPPGVPLHFMLVDTTRPFAVGERVPMRLRFQRAGTVQAEFVVVATSAEGWDAWTAP